MNIQDGRWYRNRNDDKIHIKQDRSDRYTYPFVDQFGRRYTATGMCDNNTDPRLTIKREITSQLELS